MLRRRSPASSSRISMSASRVTRNAEAPRMTIPGNSRSRFASITFSSRTNSRVFPGAPGTGTNREREGGTFTRAKAGFFSFLSASSTASDSDRFETKGNGCAGSKARGVRTGNDDVLEPGAQLFLALRVDLVPRQDAHARLGELRLQLVAQQGHRRTRVALDDLADQPQLLLRGETVGAAFGDRRFELFVQTRDADHEELVEVRVEDREELHALEERPRRIEGLLEDAAIEGEPGNLAVEVERMVFEPVVRRLTPTDVMDFAHEVETKRQGTTGARARCEEPGVSILNRTAKELYGLSEPGARRARRRRAKGRRTDRPENDSRGALFREAGECPMEQGGREVRLRRERTGASRKLDVECPKTSGRAAKLRHTASHDPPIAPTRRGPFFREARLRRRLRRGARARAGRRRRWAGRRRRTRRAARR